MERHTIIIIASAALIFCLFIYRYISKKLTPVDPFEAASSALRGRRLSTFKQSWED